MGVRRGDELEVGARREWRCGGVGRPELGSTGKALEASASIPLVVQALTSFYGVGCTRLARSEHLLHLPRFRGNNFHGSSAWQVLA